MENLYGIKELYQCFLKSTYSIDIGNRHIEPGEIILSFDNIQIGGLQEIKTRTDATGGFDNRAHVSWETTKELPLSFTQGIFSLEQLSLLSNSKIIEMLPNTSTIDISMRECVETDEQCRAQLKQIPTSVFCYDKLTGEKINDFSIEEKTILIDTPFKELIVDYVYKYANGGKTISIGNKLLKGYLSLEAKTRLKDDTDGHTVTGIIQIPKLKLMSDLSIRLGRNADPATVSFNAIGVPVGGRGASYVCNLISLNDDIDSDF